MKRVIILDNDEDLLLCDQCLDELPIREYQVIDYYYEGSRDLICDRCDYDENGCDEDGYDDDDCEMANSLYDQCQRESGEHTPMNYP